jgi:hypothetical protein
MIKPEIKAKRVHGKALSKTALKQVILMSGGTKRNNSVSPVPHVSSMTQSQPER